MTHARYLEALSLPASAVCGGDGLTQHEPPPEPVRAAHDPDLPDGVARQAQGCSLLAAAADLLTPRDVEALRG